MKKMWIPALVGSLMLVLYAASPVFGSFNMGGAEPVGKENPGPPLYYVVKFDGPIQQEWKDQLADEGGEILGYIPHFAFKVRMNPAQAKVVEELETVSAVAPFLAEYKLSPRLASEGTNLYRVKVERGADAGMVTAAIAKTNAQILLRQGNLMMIAADAEDLQPISEILDVAWIENFQFHEKFNDGARSIMGAVSLGGTDIPYDGSGQIVAITDTGLGRGTPNSAHDGLPAARINSIINRTSPDIPGCWDVVDDGAVDEASGHGTHVVLSAIGEGGDSGEGKGIAPGAHLVFQAVEDWIQMKGLFCTLLYPSGYYLVGIPYDLRELYQEAYDGGARTHSNSWGSLGLGEYTIDSSNTDDFIWNNQDASIIFAAGNDGLDLDPPFGEIDTCDAQIFNGLFNCLLASPGTAKNVITVGASENARPSYPCDTSSPVPNFTGCQALEGENEIFPYYQLGSYFDPPIATDLSAGNAEQMAAFSSRGPSFDGRIKPDVVAPGTWILSGYSDLYQEGYDKTANRQSDAYQYPGWGFPYDENYKYMAGTSMSAPLVAGGAAVVREYYEKEHTHNASAALVKATLINSAVDMLDENNDNPLGEGDNDYPIPNGHEGWGRVNLANATDGSHDFVEETTGLITATIPEDSATYTYSVTGSEPFKVSLVWSDYPKMSGFIEWEPFFGVKLMISPGPALVNDLDMVVTAPDGTVYHGNNFSGGWTQITDLTDPSVPLPVDRLNNVENVYVENPLAGDWTVTVTGYNIPMGPQPYALVVDGVESASTTPAPTADFSAAPTTGTAPTDVQFTDKSSVDVTDWSWAFGDGGTSNAKSPMHTYATTGTFTVSLTATGPSGSDIMTMSNYINVTGPSPTPTPTPTPPPSGDSITVTKANYNSKKNGGTMEVHATSTLDPNTSLYSFYDAQTAGTLMIHNDKRGRWVLKHSPVSTKPQTVTVCNVDSLPDSAATCSDPYAAEGK